MAPPHLAATQRHNAPFDEAFLRKLGRLEIAARRVRAGVLRGERRSVKRGQSVEFADFRTYSHGDDLRRVDWNVYARLERAFLKLYYEEEDRTVHVLLDTSASMDWGEPNKLGYARKSREGLAQEKGGRRGAAHAFANVGVAAICAVASSNRSHKVRNSRKLNRRRTSSWSHPPILRSATSHSIGTVRISGVASAFLRTRAS